jgi:type IV pilus assembly protein PilW
LTCAAGGGGPDALAISYEADSSNSVATSGGAATDCLGQSLPSSATTINIWDPSGGSSSPTAVTYTVANNLFYIGTSSVITSPSLYCRGNGNAIPQPLVENIEDMQFVYGTAAAAATSTLSVAGYLSASGIANDAGLAALASDADRWSKVVTVRICVLVRSEAFVVSDADSAQYVQCDGTVNTAPPDLRLRRAYTTTVVLRNRAAL